METGESITKKYRQARPPAANRLPANGRIQPNRVVDEENAVKIIETRLNSGVKDGYY